jgi:predicted ATPase/DNA-binding SARP family transcriptional activator
MLRFGILGSVEVYGFEGRAVSVGGPRQVRLLALLLVHAGRAVSTDLLRDALWGGERPDGADKRVQMAVARLRKALDAVGGGAALRTVAGGYQLVVRPDELDAQVFETTMRAGRRALIGGDPDGAAKMLGNALDLWRGAALSDVSYEDWAQLEIRRLEELRLDAVQARVEAQLRLNRSDAVLGELEALVAKHPEREQLVSQLMLALYRCGRQADALEVFQRTRNRLVEELGLEPGPALSAVQRKILAQDPALLPDAPAPTAGPARPPSASRLPTAPTPLIGRESAIETALKLLRQPGRRLLSLTGPGGVGKTRLAIAVAERLAADFDGHAWFISLASLRDSSLVFDAIADELSIARPAGRTTRDVVTDYLRASRALLVIDNVEHLAGIEHELGALLSTCRDAVVLATGRAPLRLHAECELRVQPLAVSGDSPQPPAVALFVERWRAHQPEIALDAGQIELVRRICARLDGLPLAIELAAARAPIVSLQAMLTRLERRLPVLARGGADVPERQRTLEAAIGWSHDLLPPAEQEVFARLSVFVAGFTLDAAEAVCEGADVLDILDRLVSKSLVLARPDNQSGESRFAMLETIREFASGRLRASGRDHAAHAAMIDYLCELARQQQWSILGPEYSESTRWFRRELDNFRATMQWARGAERFDVCLVLACALWWYLFPLGAVGEARKWLRLGLAARDAPAELRVNALAGLCYTAGMQQDTGAVAAERDELARTLTAAQDPRIRSLGHMALGVIALADGDFETCRLESLAAADVSRGVHGYFVAGGLNNAAHACMQLDRVEEAAEYLTEGLDLLRRTGAPSSAELDLTINLATVNLARGELERAAHGYRAVLEHADIHAYLVQLAGAIQGVCWCAAHHPLHAPAARLLGFADAQWAELTLPRDGHEANLHRQALETLRDALGDSRLSELQTHGATLDPADALADARWLAEQLCESPQRRHGRASTGEPTA